MPELTPGEVQALSHAMLVLETLANRLGGSQGDRLRHARKLVRLVLTGESIIEDGSSVPADPHESGTAAPSG